MALVAVPGWLPRGQLVDSRNRPRPVVTGGDGEEDSGLLAEAAASRAVAVGVPARAAPVRFSLLRSGASWAGAPVSAGRGEINTELEASQAAEGAAAARPLAGCDVREFVGVTDRGVVGGEGVMPNF